MISVQDLKHYILNSQQTVLIGDYFAEETAMTCGGRRVVPVAVQTTRYLLYLHNINIYMANSTYYL